MEFDEHDPWNEPSHRHERASELITHESLWDCVNELAPFGSDEGADAYYEYRGWREDNPNVKLTACIDWILGGRMDDYNESLAKVVSVELSDRSAESFDYSDAFTLDATIIATVLGQLVDEGRIDVEVKPFAYAAIARQSHPLILSGYNNESVSAERLKILEEVRRVIEAS